MNARWTRAALLASLLWALAPTPRAQAIDTLFTWQTYDKEGVTRVQVFASNDEDRPITVVVDELAENEAGAVTDDARYFVDTFGRQFGYDSNLSNALKSPLVYATALQAQERRFIFG